MKHTSLFLSVSFIAFFICEANGSGTVERMPALPAPQGEVIQQIAQHIAQQIVPQIAQQLAQQIAQVDPHLTGIVMSHSFQVLSNKDLNNIALKNALRGAAIGVLATGACATLYQVYYWLYDNDEEHNPMAQPLPKTNRTD